MAYLSVTAFKARSVMPPEDLEAVERAAPGWLELQLEQCSRLDIDARLRKRYAAPFDENDAPAAVASWLARIVTWRAYLRRGVDGTDAIVRLMEDDHKDAKDEIREAADSEDGLFDLPLRDADKASGAVLGTPFGFSEPGPYDWTDAQLEEVRK